MTLLDIRKRFIMTSGRYDLVVDATNYADNGADFYIQSGQKYLDRKINIHKAWGKVFEDVVAGDYSLNFQSCRAIKEIWIADTESRTQLEQVPMKDLRGTDEATGENNFVKPFADTTQGRPLYFSPALLRRMPEGETFTDSDLITSYLDTQNIYDPSYNGIIFMPPADGAYEIEIVGLFYSKKLTEDTHTNVWTEEYPNLLIMSALRQLEVFFRGSKSVTAWDQAIADELLDVEKDLVEEEINQVTKLEG